MPELRVKRLGRPPQTAAQKRSLDYYRALIRAEEHIRMLNLVALGELKVDPERITVAMYLINKVMPNVASLKVNMGDGSRVTVVEVPSMMRSTEDWERAVEERRAIAAKPVNGGNNGNDGFAEGHGNGSHYQGAAGPHVNGNRGGEREND